jgi:UDP-N-acetyl-D-mannosaminuronic acid transferase (WecB/TagA/CpsF family)
MQQVGLEWAFRVGLEPRRLFWRYFTSNPVAMFLLLTQTS